MEISFRKMNSMDIQRVWELECACFSCPWSQSSLRDELRNKIAHYELLEVDKEVVGYAGMWIMFGEAHITNVAISPDFRRMGLGRKLMQHMFLVAGQHKAQAMTLEVREHNEAAKSLYYQLGFKKVGERKRYYTDTGESAYILWNHHIADSIDTSCAGC